MDRHFRLGRALIGIACGTVFALASGPAPAPAQEKQLTVWWVKGFYKSEDDALFDAIKKFEAKSGIKLNLSQYAVQDMIPKTVSALDAGTPPDVAYADVYDFQVAGKWAYDGKLEDISSIIEPMKPRFSPNTVETAFLYNDKAKRKAYYAFPLKQQTMHIQYWSDMLETAGFKESDIPKTWKDYWAFWCGARAASATMPSACRWGSIPRTRSTRSSPSWTPTMSSWSTTTASCSSVIPR
jgi:multiple sugar transport system substrate-binding protein